MIPPKQLILAGDMVVLNNSDCGIFYSANRDLIVLVWRQLKHTLLKNSFYASVNESVLREQASKVPEVLGEVDRELHESIINELDLKDIKHQTDYSLLDISYLLGEKTATTADIADKAKMEDLDLVDVSIEAIEEVGVANESKVKEIRRVVKEHVSTKQLNLNEAKPGESIDLEEVAETLEF